MVAPMGMRSNLFIRLFTKKTPNILEPFGKLTHFWMEFHLVQFVISSERVVDTRSMIASRFNLVTFCRHCVGWRWSSLVGTHCSVQWHSFHPFVLYHRPYEWSMWRQWPLSVGRSVNTHTLESIHSIQTLHLKRIWSTNFCVCFHTTTNNILNKNCPGEFTCHTHTHSNTIESSPVRLVSCRARNLRNSHMHGTTGTHSSWCIHIHFHINLDPICKGCQCLVCAPPTVSDSSESVHHHLGA